MGRKLQSSLLAIAFTSVLLLSGSAQASHHGGKMMGHGSPQDRAAQQTEHMTEALGLSEEQSRQVGEINLKYATEAQASMETAATREERHSRMREIMARRDKELREILDDQQYETFQNMRNEMRKAWKKRDGNGDL